MGYFGALKTQSNPPKSPFRTGGILRHAGLLSLGAISTCRKQAKEEGEGLKKTISNS